MDNLYSNAILKLINAYSQRISKYASALDKVNSLNETILAGSDIKKNELITKLNNIVNTNIEILNILRELFTKENDMFTLNTILVKEINDGLNLTIEELKSSVEGLKPTIEGFESTAEGLKPTIGGLESTIEGLKPTIEGLKSTIEGLDITKEGMKLNKEGIELTNKGNSLTIDFLKEIAEVLGNSICIPESKSEEPPPPALTPEQVREKIIQSRGILRKPFLEYFKRKYKLDKIPKRLAFIMEDIYIKSTTTQRHIKSAARSSRITVERAFSVLRKHGWIKLKSSRKFEKYILTEKGKAFIEKVVNSL